MHVKYHITFVIYDPFFLSFLFMCIFIVPFFQICAIWKMIFTNPPSPFFFLFFFSLLESEYEEFDAPSIFLLGLSIGYSWWELVYCFLLVQVIRASGLVKIVGNNLAGSVKLNDFTMSLKWSNIGNLRLYLIQVLLNIAITQNKILFCLFINKSFNIIFCCSLWCGQLFKQFSCLTQTHTSQKVFLCPSSMV